MRSATPFRFAALAALLLAATAGDVRAQSEPEAAVTVSAALPNPIRTTARFTVSVRRGQAVRVELHNVLGQRVQTVFDGRLDAGETRTLNLSADGLPPGIYLYRVQGERSVVTRQVIVSR